MDLIGNTEPICPYCGAVLKRKPARKTKCKACGNFMYVRTRPADNQKILVTEAQREQVEEQWAIASGYHAEFLAEKENRERVRADLARRFGCQPSENDVQWAILNQELLDHSRDNYWGFYRNSRLRMGDILRRDSRLDAALVTYLEVCYLDLNGPENRGPNFDVTLMKDFPPFDPRNTATLAPGVIGYIFEIVKNQGIAQTRVESQFFNMAKSVHAALRLPVAPEDAWPTIHEELRDAFEPAEGRCEACGTPQCKLTRIDSGQSVCQACLRDIRGSESPANA